MVIAVVGRVVILPAVVTLAPITRVGISASKAYYAILVPASVATRA